MYPSTQLIIIDTMANYKKHITSDHHILLGKPIIKGTRITVELILKKLSEGATTEEVSEQFHLSLLKIYAALEYASVRLGDREEFVV